MYFKQLRKKRNIKNNLIEITKDYCKSLMAKMKEKFKSEKEF